MAVAAAALCMLIRAQQPQLAGVCAVAAGGMLLLSALEAMEDVQSTFSRLASLGGLEDGYLDVLVKVLGMSYTSELAAQTCADLGEAGLGMKVEMAGKLCVFALTAPMLLTMLEKILELAP